MIRVVKDCRARVDTGMDAVDGVLDFGDLRPLESTPPSRAVALADHAPDPQQAAAGAMSTATAQLLWSACHTALRCGAS